MLLRILFLAAVAGDAVNSEKPNFRPEESYARNSRSIPDEGTVRGEPGVDFPNYESIPRTSFRCSKQIPGFYADFETGCQVFHLCYEQRQESFLCPRGTIFSQPILACDYWYSAQCSLVPSYHSTNAPNSATSVDGQLFAVQQNPLPAETDENGAPPISPSSPEDGIKTVTFIAATSAPSEQTIYTPVALETGSLTMETGTETTTLNLHLKEAMTDGKSHQAIHREAEDEIASISKDRLRSENILQAVANSKLVSIVSIPSPDSVPMVETKMDKSVDFESAELRRRNPRKWEMTFLRAFAERLKAAKSSNQAQKSISSLRKRNFPVLKQIPPIASHYAQSPISPKQQLIAFYLKLLKMIFTRPETFLESNYFIPGLSAASGNFLL